MAHRFGYRFEAILEANCTQIIGASGIKVVGWNHCYFKYNLIRDKILASWNILELGD